MASVLHGSGRVVACAPARTKTPADSPKNQPARTRHDQRA
jgi:hypothetical protein